MAASARPRIRVASWPPWYAPNPYVELYQRALSPHGIGHVPHLPLNARRLAKHAVDVAHLHWAEWAWQSSHGFLRRPGLRSLRRFVTGLEEHGITLVWTVHNLSPHERTHELDAEGLCLLHERARLRIFHSESARAAALERFGGAGDTLVMPHGNYDGVLPPPGDRHEVRAALGLAAGTRLLLIAGNLRGYKGIEHAIEMLGPGTGLSGFRLFIGGRAQPELARMIEARARAHPRVMTGIGRLSAQRLADLHAAADAVLLPYREITSSGALLMALTQSRGVITTPRPYFREVLEPEPLAAVIAAGDPPADLAEACGRFFDVEPGERGAAARRLADRYDWGRMVEPVAKWLLANVDGRNRRHTDASW